MAPWVRWFLAAAIMMGVAGPLFAEYESESTSSVAEAPSTDEEFSKIVNVERYLEGRTTYTTLAMIRNVGTALHNDNLKAQQQMAELKSQVQQLEDQVRRLSSGSHQPAGDGPASSRGSHQPAGNGPASSRGSRQ